MDIQNLQAFFMWCTFINGAILCLWTGFFMLVPDTVYNIQKKWFPLPRETFNGIIYALLGFFKIIFLFFNAVPYAALQIGYTHTLKTK